MTIKPTTDMPKKPKAPKLLLALLAAQTKRLQRMIEPAPCPCRAECWTLRLKAKPEFELHSRVFTEERAETRFDITQLCDEDGNDKRDGWWTEGKPCVEECYTEYFVGSHKLTVPDSFNPCRYL